MSKRRHEDDDFVNVLKQKHKQDPLLKQKAAHNTFAMLMNAQRQNKSNGHHVMDELACEKCQRGTKVNRCYFCEKGMCANCLQECIACLENYCSTCSTIDYSQAYERIFCLSCNNS